MNEEKKICFTSYAFGSYQKYIPFYIYFILKEYPNYYVKIFIEKELDNKVEQALNKLKQFNYTNFEIIKSDFEDNKIFDAYKIKGGGPKTLFRWLFDEKYFTEFDYVYYGDIDVFIMHENQSIIAHHSQIIGSHKTPFSNKVRKDDFGNLTNRLSGLHFVETKPYFKKINPIINSILSDSNFRTEIMKNVERDENLLYELNKKAFDFNDEEFTTIKTPLHGLHIGIARHLEMLTKETLAANSTLDLNKLKNILPIYYNDKIFKAIQNIIFLVEIYRINKFLGLKNNFNFKLKYLHFNIINAKNKLVKKIKNTLNG